MKTRLLITLLLAAVLSGCGGAPVATAGYEPHAAIKGLDLTGRWYSQDFGDLDLVQSGPKLTGKYEHPRGPEHNGTLTGEIEGDVLHLRWVQPGDMAAAIRTVTGRAVFRIRADGLKLKGVWGYNELESGGGEWNADKSQQQPQ